MTSPTRRAALLRNVCARLCSDQRTEDEIRVIDDVLTGIERGSRLYGPLDLATDTRDWAKEVAEECRDLLAYLAMARVAAQHVKREQLLARQASEMPLVELDDGERGVLFAFDMTGED